MEPGLALTLWQIFNIVLLIVVVVVIVKIVKKFLGKSNEKDVS